MLRHFKDWVKAHSLQGLYDVFLKEYPKLFENGHFEKEMLRDKFSPWHSSFLTERRSQREKKKKTDKKKKICSTKEKYAPAIVLYTPLTALMKLSQPYSSARPCFLFSCVFLSSFERNTRSVLVFLSFSLLCCFSCACACLCVFYHLDRKIMNSFRESSRVMLLYGNFCCWPFFYSSSLFRGEKKEEQQSKVREFRNDLKAKYLCLIFVFVLVCFQIEFIE